MTNIKSQVKIAELLSREIHIYNRLLQDGLACLLFSLALEKEIRDSGTQTREIIVTRSSQIDIIGRTEQAVHDSFTQAAQNLRLHVSKGKPKYIVASTARKTPGQTVKVAGHEF